MNEFKNIPLPSTVEKTEDITIADVIESIKTIVTFAKFRNKINTILDSLIEYGIDINAINNPDQLMKQLIRLKSTESRNKSISIEEIDKLISDIESFKSIKLSDIDRSIRIINRYNALSKSVDTVVKYVSKPVISENILTDLAKSILGVNGKKKRISKEEEEEYEIAKPTDKDIEEIKRILNEM